jgi:hypothetical protein
MRTMWSAADFVYPTLRRGRRYCGVKRQGQRLTSRQTFISIGAFCRDLCGSRFLTATVKFLHAEPATTAEVAHQKFTSVYFRPRSPSDHDRSHVRHNEISP